MSTSEFSYQDVTLETSWELFESPEAEEFYIYWKSRSRDGALPLWKDFNLVDVPKLVPNLILIEAGENPTVFRIKMVGTKLIQVGGRDGTGLDMGQYKGTERGVDRLAQVVASDCGYYLSNAPVDWSDRGYKEHSALMLPTTDENGKVTHLVGWIGDFH